MRSREVKTNFSMGVVLPDAIAREDLQGYNNGLQVADNVVVQSMGGLSRRAGTLFVRDYGAHKTIRIVPFMFNRDQKYIVVFTLGMIDIYRDNVNVSSVVSPYRTADQLNELDYAQSADIMVISHSEVEPQTLRRLGDDSSWDIVPAPIINPPQFNCDEEEPPVCEDVWTDENGYPQRCTFHQGRLWFANNNKRPQSVWSSKAQDFFNFDLGDQDAGDSIQETLDTDLINPIVNIFSGNTLQVFSIGAEFVNIAEVITPQSSAWLRQSDYGSKPFVEPISVDGSTLYLDSTGRTVRNFVYTDTTSSYSAPSISLLAENLIREPIRLGAMRGGTLEASNFIYVVNIDGTMAVCNLAKEQQMIAWTSWSTQGFYKDVINLDRELYVLVERYVSPDGEFVTYEGTTVTYNGEPVWYGDNPDALSKHWFLEKVSGLANTDCGNIVNSIVESELTYLRKDDNNFFGVYQDVDGRGKVVLVENGSVVYQTAFLKDKPLSNILTEQDERYSALNVFNTDNTIREKYFDEERGYLWFMYSMTKIQLLNMAKDYVDGLSHLLGLKVDCNLDGIVYPNETVIEGDSVVTVERTYPDGVEWLYDDDNRIIRTQTESGFSVIAYYNGILYENLIESEYGYLIAGANGEPDAEYLQLGNVEQVGSVGSVTIDYNAISGDNSETVTGSDGSFVFTAPIGVFELRVCMSGGGGSGSILLNSSDTGNTFAGKRGAYLNGVKVAIDDEEQLVLTIGLGGAGVTGTSTSGKAGSASTLVAISETLTASGGVGGSGVFGEYKGNGGNPITTCGGSFVDGLLVGGSMTAWGGQAGCFGNGGNGGTVNGVAGGLGAGGGGCRGGSAYRSGDGGNGRLVLEWEAPLQYFHKTRLMKLQETTVSDGIVPFPNTPFRVGEVGLSYRVFAETTLLAPSAGAGSLINEPKRIVSITARFRNTQGVNVQGYDIPERDFGEDVLDVRTPLLTGTTKLRILGYNRQTSVRISQSDPIPFTLLGLDVEINY